MSEDSGPPFAMGRGKVGACKLDKNLAVAPQRPCVMKLVVQGCVNPAHTAGLRGLPQSAADICRFPGQGCCDIDEPGKRAILITDVPVARPVHLLVVKGVSHNACLQMRRATVAAVVPLETVSLTLQKGGGLPA